MDSRRNFLGKFASGLAGTLAVPARVLGASDRIRLGVIGAGDRGTELVRQAVSCPGIECAAFADVYTRRLDAARQLVPAAAAHLDYRRLLDDNSIDAVLIASPQHLHCEHFVSSLAAGKHVYVEKTMAFTVEQAKRMRAAFRRDAGKRAVQIGHQSCSSGLLADAVEFLRSPGVGKITAINARMYRNTPSGKPQWSRPVYPDMNAESIAWISFLGEAPTREFDANRYVNWRYFWDYSGGNVFENMSHQLAFWYRALNLQIPAAASMTGGVYLWKDGREVPDTMHVALEQPEEILFSWESGFGNNHPGISEEVLGTSGTIVKGQQIRYFPQKVNRPEGAEIPGRTPTPPTVHLQNFFDAIRLGKQPNCGFDLGYRVSIACRMAVESYLQGRLVRWDPAREEIV